MLKRKNIRERGKLGLSRYFQRFNEGDKVAVKRELSLKAKFPRRIQGRTGIITGERGNSYIVSIMDYKQEKSFIIEPIHLKKIKN
ncbi:50S ribosomal protein L21e [Candidatus Pacearchaeota archaeon]|nr:50S ribosomal protein L21e [Candidatus Pacearchaeota archaeon]